MTMKKLLGLESSPLEEREIVRMIQEAQQQKKPEIEFLVGTRKIKLKLSQISPDGLMRDYHDYYHAQ
ncbi:hypothetical protein HYU22_05155 [Candidatus Woesearchaeota archaeon]|nr:hypothetical protein [Candidatus Woesearchaeota archaeon]